MMEMTLYEIAPELRALAEAEEFDVERINELAMTFERKAAGLIAVSENMDRFVSYCKEEEARIAAKRKAVENRIQRMKDYLLNCMDTAEIASLELGTKKISIQPNPPKVVIDNEEVIPARFIKIVQTQSIDKNAIRDALKLGEVVPGAHTEQGLSLRIK